MCEVAQHREGAAKPNFLFLALTRSLKIQWRLVVRGLISPHLTDDQENNIDYREQLEQT
jgi:hypothetical protein